MNNFSRVVSPKIIHLLDANANILDVKKLLFARIPVGVEQRCTVKHRNFANAIIKSSINGEE